MRQVVVGLLMTGLALMQGTLLWGRGPGHVTLDLVLVLTLSAGAALGPAAGAGWGFWGGLLLGATAGNLEGPLALAYTALGWWAAEWQPRRRLAGALLAGALWLVVQYLAFNALYPTSTCCLPAPALLLPVYHALLFWPLQAALRPSARPVVARAPKPHQSWQHKAQWGLD